MLKTIAYRLRFGFSESAIKRKLIQTSLEYVPKYGWNTKPIHVACSMLDLSPAAHKVISPFDMIAYSMKKWNEQSLKIVDDTNFEGRKKISDKIQFAIKTRLQRQIPFLDTWGEAMALGAHPQNLPKTKDLLWDYSSQIWYRCGDKSTDYNYYSKRILFNSAYASTELFMLTDKSKQYFATWEFLRRRLDNILAVGKTVNDISTVFSHAGDGLLSLFTMFKTPQKYENPIEQYQNQMNEQTELQVGKKQAQQPIKSNEKAEDKQSLSKQGLSSI